MSEVFRKKNHVIDGKIKPASRGDMVVESEGFQELQDKIEKGYEMNPEQFDVTDNASEHFEELKDNLEHNIDAVGILKKSCEHLSDRASSYDKNGGRSIPRIVKSFNAVTGHNLTAEQGWLFMSLVKIVRTQQGDYRADNYEDLAAYSALMGEQAYEDSFDLSGSDEG